MTTLKYEHSHTGLVIGVDEVGRGPLAGPVVACACVLPDKNLPCDIIPHITDSKKISPAKRIQLYPHLQRHTLYAFGICDVDEIDTLNILNATMCAMTRAITSVMDITPTPAQHVLIDGNRIPHNCPLPATPIVKGDTISVSIACASILAKVYRDTLMQDLAKHYPVYHWQDNAGYGTAQHRRAIQTHGITPHHRKTFSPIKEIIADDSLLKD